MAQGKPEEVKKGLDTALALRQINVYAYKFFNVIIIFVVIMIFFGSYKMLLRPKYNSILNEDEIRQKRTEYTQKLDYLMQLRDLRAAYDKILQDDKDKINAIINNTNEKEDLFKEMQFLAVREGVTLESLDVLPLDDSYELEDLAGNNKRSQLFDQVRVVRTTITLADITYESLFNTLKTIELNLRIMDVNKVDYDPFNQRAVIELLTYQLK